MEVIKFIQIEPNELKSLLMEGVQQVINQIREEFQPKTPTEYLTRKEVAKMLHIDLKTLKNWTKNRVLTSYGIQRRVYYKRDEVERAFIELKQK